MRHGGPEHVGVEANEPVRVLGDHGHVVDPVEQHRHLLLAAEYRRTARGEGLTHPNFTVWFVP